MSTNTGMSSCCMSGKIRDGNPVGHVETVGGLNTYVSAPEGGSKEKTVIFLTDIFGYEFKNVRLLADNYAKAGFFAYIPDVLQGDPLPISFLDNVEPNLKTQETLTMVDKAKNTAQVPITLGPWLVSHREAVSRPIIDGFVNAVRMIPGTNKIGCIGFCWGGRYAILQAHGQSKSAEGSSIGGVDAAVAMHPSLMSIPADFEGLSKPLSVGLGTKDSLVDEKTRGQIQDTLAKMTDVPHEVRIYEDQIHGFALRGDWSSDKDKESIDEAEKQGIEWFKKYLS
ncbi:hypothetical protein MMC25_004772 [Agyrium rufum]|nr:hypothetical protein [Agyrium rufum]